MKAVLIVVDMQNDFIHEDGHIGLLAKENAPFDMEFLASPVPNIKRLAAAFRAADSPVIYLMMVLKPDYSDACFPYWRFRQLTHQPTERQPLMEGTWGAQIVKELTPEKGDYVVVKKGYGGFYNTPLEPMLRNLGVDTCAIAGVNTPVCVSTTCREGVSRNFRMIVVSDGTASLSRESHEAELSILAKPFADIKTTDEVIEMLK